MKKPIILIGVGEIGGVFARGFLRNGYPVYPVTREMELNIVADRLEDPEAVVVAVGEKDVHSVLEQMPDVWRNSLVLLQNELLPLDWEQHQLDNPTVISVWFEKKQPNDFKVIIPSPVYGPKAQLIADSLGILNIVCEVLTSEEKLLFELILKNLYILTVNIAGLKVGGNVGELWGQHQQLARDVASDILDIQFWIAGKEFDRGELIAGMVKAFEGDLAHKCMGRSALARLERALTQAEEAGLSADNLGLISKAAK